MKILQLAIGCDHAGYDLKESIKAALEIAGHHINDFGGYSNKSTDYPDYAHPVAKSVENGEADLGILICGSGNGINMTANKHQGIRSALCWQAEIAELARAHNDANIVALPARYISEELAHEIVNRFLETPFDGGRHARRVEKISQTAAS